MSTIDTHAAPARSATVPASVSGAAEWVTSADHKRLGRLMIGGAMLSAIVVAAVGAVLAFERITTDNFELIPISAAPEWTAFFGHGLVFLVLAPLFLGLAVAIVPLQVGARALSFGRLAQFGAWTWFFGTALVVVSLGAGGGPSGERADLVELFLFGVILTLAGLVAVSVSVAATVLTSRTAGMDLMFVPAFSWSALIGSAATLLTLPVGIGTTIFMFVEQSHIGTTFGETLDLATPVAWLGQTPTTLIFAVAVLGLAAEIAPVTFGVRQVLRPVMLIGVGVASAAMLTGITQTQHVLDLGGAGGDDLRSLVLFALFNLLPLLGIVLVLGAVALTARAGSASFSAPFAAAMLGLVSVLVAGGLSALMHVKSLELVGTVYDEGTRTFLVYGVLVAGFGAVAWWFPKWTGRKMGGAKVLLLSATGFAGTVLASVPYLIAGYDGQPSGALFGYDYSGFGKWWSAIAGVGHVLVLLATVGFAAAALRDARRGESAGDDPWNAHTLEWSVSSPAPASNFAELATVGSAEPLLDIKTSRGGDR